VWYNGQGRDHDHDQDQDQGEKGGEARDFAEINEDCICLGGYNGKHGTNGLCLLRVEQWRLGFRQTLEVLDVSICIRKAFLESWNRNDA